jgi:hypothetical protein
VFPVRYELYLCVPYGSHSKQRDPTLSEGLAGYAWEPSKQNLFLTPELLGSASHCPPPLNSNHSLSLSLSVNSDCSLKQH